MRESEGKWKEAGAAESLAPKSFINDQDVCYYVAWGLYSVPAMKNYQNI